ncbi:hypothetical protein [Victivallis sp. Marseille-Q1083]|uniref:hypothetical protein n=1 Tax=Victivallis sp. Marseille-Q1083 TaxID=2717288 RepID=UPI00158BE915|nr:hypothetical protein [Victivallis sp. Marseille-Q1083]
MKKQNGIAAGTLARGIVVAAFVAAAALLQGCEALQNKAVGIGSGVDAFKVETSGSLSSGTVLPNIIAGGAVNAMGTSPEMAEGSTAAPVYVHSRRGSFFGQLFGLNVDTEAVVYIGVPGETAADTIARMQAIRQPPETPETAAAE